MKKTIIGGLVGILIGLGINSQAIEVNKDGFEVPNKNKAQLVDSISYEHNEGDIVVNGYRGE